MQIDGLDHVVLTVRDVVITSEWYQRVLGMQEQTFGAGRIALQFGRQKINLHPAAAPFKPNADQPMPGSADLCFVTTTTLAKVLAHLQACEVVLELGPVERTGALGPIESVYVRDPDANLIEIARYL